jgi:hypothetical protein
MLDKKAQKAQLFHTNWNIVLLRDFQTVFRKLRQVILIRKKLIFEYRDKSVLR